MSADHNLIYRPLLVVVPEFAFEQLSVYGSFGVQKIPPVKPRVGNRLCTSSVYSPYCSM